jgi:hypothetical protein
MKMKMNFKIYLKQNKLFLIKKFNKKNKNKIFLEFKKI